MMRLCVDADTWISAVGAAATTGAVIVALGVALRDGRVRDDERRDH